MKSKPVRTRIRRLYVADAIYFITAVARGRQPLFADDNHLAILRETMREVKKIHPFQMRAYVFIPDHFHLLLRVGNETDISRTLQSIQRNFTLNYKAATGIQGRVKVWQRGFWDHVIRDERDYLNHMHYIHFNPVKHGLVTKPADYPHSSFHEYVRRGWYEETWGEVEPEEIAGWNHE